MSIGSRSRPDADDRRQLESRRRELDTKLVHDPREAARVIGRLMATNATFGLDAVAAQQTRALYVEACQGLSAWALDAARLAFGAGRNRVAWDRQRCPSSAQLAEEARLFERQFEDECRAIAAILDAEVFDEPSPDELKARRAKVGELLAGLADSMKMASAGQDGGQKREREALRRENARALARDHAAMAAAGVPVPTIGGFAVSAALAANIAEHAEKTGAGEGV